MNRPIYNRWRVSLRVSHLPYLMYRWAFSSLFISYYIFMATWYTFRVKLSSKSEDKRPLLLKNYFERMGGAWIKLGQILAMRIDFLPKAYVEQLSNLLDNVKAFDTKTAKRILEAELPKSLDQIFIEFPEEAIAAASFGQVYETRLLNGEKVAVKVQRPNIRKQVASDMLMLRVLTAILDFFSFYGNIRAGEMVKELQLIMEEELDYRWEGANIYEAWLAARHYTVLKVPQFYQEFSTQKVLVMEFFEGVWMTEILAALRNKDQKELQRFKEMGLDLPLIGRRMFDIGMRQFFEVHRFHADPHAANIVVMPGNVIGYIDYGIIGSIDKKLINNQLNYFSNIINNDIQAAVDAATNLIDVSKHNEKVREFKQELYIYLQGWVLNNQNPDAPIDSKSTGRLLLSTIHLVQKYKFAFQQGVIRYYRALIISDIIILQLDQGFDFSVNLSRFLRRQDVRKIRFLQSEKHLRQMMHEYLQFIETAPKMAKRYAENYTAQIDYIEEGFVNFKQLASRMSPLFFVILLFVLGARLFGNHTDIMKIFDASAAYSLNWIVAAGISFLLWRGLKFFAR